MGYLDAICPNCHVALLYPHPEHDIAVKGWFKCELCGYCQLDPYKKNKEKDERSKDK